MKLGEIIITLQKHPKKREIYSLYFNHISCYSKFCTLHSSKSTAPYCSSSKMMQWRLIGDKNMCKVCLFVEVLLEAFAIAKCTKITNRKDYSITYLIADFTQRWYLTGKKIQGNIRCLLTIALLFKPHPALLSRAVIHLDYVDIYITHLS